MKSKTQKKLDDIAAGYWSLHYKTPDGAMLFLIDLLNKRADMCAKMRDKLETETSIRRDLERKATDFDSVKASLDAMTAERSKWLRKLRRAGINVD